MTERTYGAGATNAADPSSSNRGIPTHFKTHTSCPLGPIHASCAPLAEHKYKGVTESALQYVVAPTTYVQFQFGLLLVVPLLVWLFVEKGFWTAVTRSFDIILKLAVAYYNFMGELCSRKACLTAQRFFLWSVRTLPVLPRAATLLVPQPEIGLNGE